MRRYLWVLGLALALLLWPQAAKAAKAIKEGAITITFGPEPETMDPHTHSSAIVATVHRYVFDTLMTRPAGEALPVPWAAKSYKVLGPRTVDFHMREGVKFTNGEDVDAEAVRFSLMRPLDPKVKSGQRGYFRNLDRVEVVSKWVARVHLKYPDPGFLNRMATWGFLAPPKYYSRMSQEEASVKPLGGGPYRMVRWRKGVEMVFEANPNYWHPDYPKVKTIRVVAIPEMGTRVAALLKGEVDVIRDIPAHLVPRIRANPRTEVHITRNVRIFHLGFTHPIGGPALDRRVRRAIAHAIDRDLLVRAVVEGMGAVTGQMFHEWTEGHDAAFKWPYEFNPEKSRKLLAEAGYPNGFSIDYFSPAGRYPKDKEVAEAVAGMLRKVGIQANYQALTWRTFVNRFRARTQAGAKPFLYYIGFGNGGGDSDATVNALASCGGVWSGYCNPALDALMNVTASTMDVKERDRLFRLMTRAMAEDVSHVFLWQADDVYGLNKKVAWKVRNDDRIYAWELDIRGR